MSLKCDYGLVFGLETLKFILMPNTSKEASINLVLQYPRLDPR